MAAQGNRPSSLQDTVAIEGELGKTRTATLYRAIDQRRNSPVSLWTLHYPLEKGTAGAREFSGRLAAIQDMRPPLVELLGSGIDGEGVAFVELAAFEGYPVVAGNIEASEGERRFLACVRIAARLHEEGISCGDICGTTFWMSRGGEVQFVGVMGALSEPSPPQFQRDTVDYIAPEQRTGAVADSSSDIFALGVLGYYLLAGRGPYGETEAGISADNFRPLRELVSNPPPWADEVLGRCVSLNPNDRPLSAGLLLQEIASVRERVLSAQNSPVRSGSRTPTTKDPRPKREVMTRPDTAPDAPAEEPKKSSNLVYIVVGTGLALGIGSGVFAVLSLTGSDSGRSTSHELSLHKDALENSELRDAVDVISKGGSNLAEQSFELEKIVGSDDPLAHEILVRSAKEAPTAEVRALSEKAIIDRARRLGLMRSSEQVRQWLRTLRGGELPSIYEPMLRSLDITLPIEARSSLLRAAYASNPRVVLKLASALVLDTAKYTDYQPVIAQLITDSRQIEDASSHASMALIMVDEELSLLFGDDVIQRREELSDADIRWLLNMLAGRADMNVRALANLALERGLIEPIAGSFLKLVRDRPDLPTEVVEALTRAAAGSLTPNEIGAFGRWYDLEAERVLLAVLATAKDPVVLSEAFDMLAAKSLTIEPSARLMAWVRKHHWDRRLEYSSVLGGLAFVKDLDNEDLKQRLSLLDGIAHEKGLLNILVDSRDSRLARMVSERYPKELGLGGLLSLLGHEDPQVRILAMAGLKDDNDVGALKYIGDRYEREKDPTVRKAYVDTFWFIREREERQAKSAASQKQ